jgi:RNA polymerase sigma factor (TIGR02999 family)
MQLHTTETLIQSLQLELKNIAHERLRRERSDHTLQATALVNEVFLKLNQPLPLKGWRDRAHFLAAASEAMRRILVDHARARLAAKRGGKRLHLQDQEVPIELPLPMEELIAIHECLDKFAEEEPVKAQLVKLRVFAGLSHGEAARELGISRQTADRYWAYARVRLFSMIR